MPVPAISHGGNARRSPAWVKRSVLGVSWRPLSTRISAKASAGSTGRSRVGSNRNRATSLSTSMNQSGSMNARTVIVSMPVAGPSATVIGREGTSKVRSPSNARTNENIGPRDVWLTRRSSTTRRDSCAKSPMPTSAVGRSTASIGSETVPKHRCVPSTAREGTSAHRRCSTPVSSKSNVPLPADKPPCVPSTNPVAASSVS